jgi:hypothetical protein
MDRDFGPDGDPLPTPAGRAVPKLKNAPDSGGIEGRVTAGLEYLNAIHSSPLRDQDSEQGLAFHIGIPEVEGILDGDLTVERSGIFHFPPVPAAHEKKGKEKDPG